MAPAEETISSTTTLITKDLFITGKSAQTVLTFAGIGVGVVAAGFYLYGASLMESVKARRWRKKHPVIIHEK